MCPQILWLYTKILSAANSLYPTEILQIYMRDMLHLLQPPNPMYLQNRTKLVSLPSWQQLFID